MNEILNEITTYCGTECSSVGECPEEACVLYRIEKRVLELSQNDEEVKYVSKGNYRGDSIRDIRD